MFTSVSELDQALCESGYIADPVTVSTVFLAAALHRPVLLEGPAGSGKTQLAYAVAEAAHTRVERLQCYQGINEEKAIGRFGYVLICPLRQNFQDAGHFSEAAKSQDSGNKVVCSSSPRCLRFPPRVCPAEEFYVYGGVR